MVIFISLKTLGIALLLFFVVLPGIVMPISIIFGYRYTHSKKYIEIHKEQIEANRLRREAERKEAQERINRKTQNVATGERIGGRSHLERMGARGEISINNILMREVVNKGWYLVKNIIISNSQNSSTQIDHIVINNSGIYVIETKNLVGVLHGNPGDRSLKHRYSGSRRDYSFHNPLKQNAVHAKALSNYLNKRYVKMSITPLTVVLGAVVKGEVGKYIYNANTLISTLRERSENKKYDDEAVKKAFKILENCCNNPTVTQKEHIERVRQAHPKQRRRKRRFPF